MGIHYKEADWSRVRNDVAREATRVREALENAEAAYQFLLVIRDGESDQIFADRLHVAPPGVATPAQVEQVTDAVAAATALHELFQAADNVAVAQADRLAALRKFL